ncbi:uncharacterized protein [Nicotiana sylvestris]|uniref:uncharacterized protein n=1 Tax=Nicotiana sylvestris TaxID=4096 RepID=UPI00388C6A05
MVAVLPSRQTSRFPSYDLGSVYTASIGHIPPSQREKLWCQFKQGQMSVTDNEARFSNLSRHALMILPTDAKRVRRFVVGLHPDIRASMAREVEIGTEYQLVVEIARMIEGYWHKGSSSAYFSAMRESLYRPPAIQGSSSGYSSQQVQALGQQSMAQRSCYECGDSGDMKRFCPRLWGKAVHQGYQPMITAPAIRPPRGGGQAGKGRHRSGGQTGGGTISVCGRDASVLFDPGSTYLYVSSLFAHFLDIPRESLGTPIYVSTPVGDSVVVDRIYRSCVVTFYGYETRTDLLLLDMIDFEVILGMDWLFPYHTILDCHAKTITLVMPEFP